MKRLLVVLLAVVGVAAVAVVVVTRSSSAAGSGVASRPGLVARVVITPKLRKILQGEISRLRLGQPRAPRVPALPAPRQFANPDRGVTCFVAGRGSRCPEIPCRQFASATVVLKLGTTVIAGPGARARHRQSVAPCPRHAPRKLILVSGP